MTGLEVAVHFVHLASALVLVGSFNFELLASRSAFKNVETQTSLDFPSFYRTLFSIARLSLLVAIGTAILGLLIKTAAATKSFCLFSLLNLRIVWNNSRKSLADSPVPALRSFWLLLMPRVIQARSTATVPADFCYRRQR
jgi:hypothetical protein